MNLEKWWIYKIYCMFLYREHESIVHVEGSTVILHSGSFCALVKIANSRLRKHLRDLQDLDMITDLVITRGVMTFKIGKDNINR